MDPSPKPFKPKYKEPAHVIEDVQEGRFRILRFRGQTILFIPQARVNVIGRENILKLAESIYTKEVLENFEWMKSDYEHSLSLELPARKVSEEGLIDEQDTRVEQLIAAIEEYK